MGCCFSSSAHDHDSSTYRSEVTEDQSADAVSRGRRSEVVAPGPGSGSAVPGTIANSSLHDQFSRNRRASQTDQPLPLSVPFNQPIRPHVWRSKRRLWTYEQLAREREEFFETRVAGRAEVWAALRAAIILLREGDVQTAQTIIDAAGVTVPTGDLCQGAYDENGALYRLPQCIVSDPENVVDHNDSTQSHNRAGLGVDEDGDGDGLSDRKLSMAEESEEELIPEDIERRREEKGKMSERDIIKVKARLSDRGGPDLMISIGKSQCVGVLARKIQSQAGLSPKQRVRIAYLGRILKEQEPLLDQGWKTGHVVNALVVTQST